MCSDRNWVVTPPFRPDACFQNAQCQQHARDGLIRRSGRSPEDWATDVTAWCDIGATHLSVRSARAGLSSPDAHVEAIRKFQKAVGEVEPSQ